MTYLLGLLDGPVHDAVAGLILSDSNYNIAVKLLKERFGSEKVIISAHMDSLLKLENVNNLDAKKLRSLYDTVELHVRGLKTVGIDSQQYGKLLVPILMDKIPSELQLIVTRKLGKDRWDLDTLLDSIKDEIETREMCVFVNASEEEKKAPPPKRENFASLQTLFTGQSDTKKPAKTCIFCGQQQHVSAKCNIVTDVSARKSVLKRQGRCYLCLRTARILRNCPSKATFKCFKCSGSHNSAICPNGATGGHDQPNPPRAIPTHFKPQTRGATSLCVNTNTSVLLQTAQGVIRNPTSPEKKVKARIIFDSCSQRSYVSHRLTDTLALNSIGTEKLLIKAFGDESPRKKECELVQLSIASNTGMELYVNAFSVPLICSPLSNQAVNVAVDKYPHLRDLELADSTTETNDVEIDVLIGADYYWNFVSGTVKRGRVAGPIALYTKLGWVLSVPVVTDCQNKPECAVNLTSTHVLRVDTTVLDPVEDPNGLHDMLSKFWDLETLGIREDEISVYDKFTQEAKFNGERYEAKLPFKEEHSVLPDNYSLCVKRLNSTLRRLQTKPDILQEYDRIITEQKLCHIVEQVQVDEPTAPGTVHYFPHREVIRMDRETTKLRVVYDASAKSAKGDDPSLNDCLYAGPSLSPLIFDILLRFRTNKVAVTGDIEKAFLNISITPEHRDYLRFLWVEE